MNTQYFSVKDFKKTSEKHHGRIVKLQDSYELDYFDVLDNSAWSDIETAVHENVTRQIEMGITPKARGVATLINYKTREVIQNSLEWHEIPRSYDTAFYIAHYCKINEGMTDILQNFIDRGEVKA